MPSTGEPLSLMIEVEPIVTNVPEDLKKNEGLHTVGWREMVEFPDWEISGVETKIDTGARTSALHVENIEELDDGEIAFDVMLVRGDPSKRIPVRSRPIRISKVKPSSGHLQTRYVVLTRIRLGPVVKQIEVSLVSRRGMLCRMLLGRTALAGDFVVQPAARYLLSNKPSPKRKGKSSSKNRIA